MNGNKFPSENNCQLFEDLGEEPWSWWDSKWKCFELEHFSFHAASLESSGRWMDWNVEISVLEFYGEHPHSLIEISSSLGSLHIESLCGQEGFKSLRSITGFRSPVFWGIRKILLYKPGILMLWTLSRAPLSTIFAFFWLWGCLMFKLNLGSDVKEGLLWNFRLYTFLWWTMPRDLHQDLATPFRTFLIFPHCAGLVLGRREKFGGVNVWNLVINIFSLCDTVLHQSSKVLPLPLP